MDFIFRSDTIAAIATPVGEGGIGLIKMSGPKALQIALKIFRPSRDAGLPPLESHRLYHGWICDPATREPVDEVLITHMAAPRTYTREDVVEINCHSGYMVLNRLLEIVLWEGARLAEPGEFTRRAFLNGRLDLSQAEAVADVIHSRARESLAAANRQLRGDLRTRIEAWREEILQLEAEIGASLDFAEDIDDAASFDPISLAQRVEERIARPIRELMAHYEDGRTLREGLALVLAGKPNVGKSSLLNGLVGKDRAIVTPVPGTTRDVIEDSFLLCGVLVRICDTAGIRRSDDTLESIGIDRALRSLEEADVVLWLIDRSSSLTEEDDLVFETIQASRHIVILNKSDLPAVVSPDEVAKRYGAAVSILELSALREADLEKLRGLLYELFLKQPIEKCNSAIIPNLRHKESLGKALGCLMRVKELLISGHVLELTSLELETARSELDTVLGRNVKEDLLDRIFSRFCIGK